MTALRLGLALALAGFLWAVTPPETPRFRLCGFHWLTGLPCPLCGLTRALFALAKGHWMEALRFHPLSPLAAAMIASLFCKATLSARMWTAGVAAFAVFGVVRLAAGI